MGKRHVVHGAEYLAPTYLGVFRDGKVVRCGLVMRVLRWNVVGWGSAWEPKSTLLWIIDWMEFGWSWFRHRTKVHIR
jgi:hypothetical protein